MTPALALELVQRAVTLTLLVAGPLLGAALLIGVGVSLFQAVTQIQEQTLTFIPKLLGVAAVGVATMPWMVRTLVEFLAESLRAIAVIGP